MQHRGSDVHKITFTGAQGDSLAARLDQPVGEPKAFALFAHCFTCSKDIFAASRIAAGLVAQGYGVLRFDFTGLGASEGEFANTNFSSNIADLLAAADWLRANHRAPTLLIGHSLGGAAVLAAADRIPEAKAVATIGAPADPAHVAHSFGDALNHIAEHGEAEVTLAGRAFRIKKQFLDDLKEHTQAEAIHQLKVALMVMHAPLDATVGIENARLIFDAARHPKSFVSLDNADHLLSNRADAIYVANVLATWAERYVVDSNRAAHAETETVEEGVRVSETGHGRYQQEVTAGRNRILADEPTDAGGDDTGLSPYELLNAALGACTSMTLRMYAERKGLKLDHVSVHVSHDRIHADDCADCESEGGFVDRFRREITLHGDLSGEETTRLMEIANKCPVHKTLHNEIVVADHLVGGDTA